MVYCLLYRASVGFHVSVESFKIWLKYIKEKTADFLILPLPISSLFLTLHDKLHVVWPRVLKLGLHSSPLHRTQVTSMKSDPSRFWSCTGKWLRCPQLLLCYLTSSSNLQLWPQGESRMTSWLRNEKLKPSGWMAVHNMLVPPQNEQLEHHSPVQDGSEGWWFRGILPAGRTSSKVPGCPFFPEWNMSSDRMSPGYQLGWTVKDLEGIQLENWQQESLGRKHVERPLQCTQRVNTFVLHGNAYQRAPTSENCKCLRAFPQPLMALPNGLLSRVVMATRMEFICGFGNMTSIH